MTREAGPNELELREILRDKVENHGLLNMHISWGPEGEKMSPEEKSRYIIDHIINRDTSQDKPISASEFDRQTLADHVSPEEWEFMDSVAKRAEINKATAKRMAEVRMPPDDGLPEQVRGYDETLSAFQVLLDAFRKEEGIE